MTPRHVTTCRKAFHHYDMTCPRCIELAHGAPARPGWSETAKRAAAARTEAIRTHDFSACAAKHVVCTCFDW